MNIEELRDYCISKKGVEETLPFGPDTLVFKVIGKVFLLAGLDSSPLEFNVKCDPEIAVELRDQYSCVIPGFHMNKKHWNTIIADGSVPDKKLKEWIDHSYEMVVKGLTKKVKETLK
jgi:predicted DNA-binding protein (MmcQ/YjbR family)